MSRHNLLGRPLSQREKGEEHRAGFTLLEVVLAMSIGLVLLVALYLALDIQIQHAQVGREVVDQASQARLLLQQISGDILGHLGPRLQQSTSSSQSSSQQTSTSSSSTSSSSTGSDSGSSNTDSSTSTSTTSAGRVVFNLGVKGEAQRLILSISRLPREGFTAAAGLSDLRRISYWLLEGDGGGLARQDLTRVTAEDVQALPPDVSDPESFLVAPEVKELTFQYFDGSSWQDSWDGGETKGPPLAIAITLRLTSPGDDQGTVYRHVVAIPTANGRASDQNTSQP